MIKSNMNKESNRGIIKLVTKSLDEVTNYALKNLNLSKDYTKKQSAGMSSPSDNQSKNPPENGAPTNSSEPKPAQKKELDQAKKRLQLSKKKNKKLLRKNKTLKIENNDLRKKLTSVSEDIVKLQDVLPNINHQIKQLLKDINSYKVYKTENEQNNKYSVEKPFIEKKNLQKEQTEPDYKSVLNKSKKGKRVKSNNKQSNKQSNNESIV